MPSKENEAPRTDIRGILTSFGGAKSAEAEDQRSSANSRSRSSAKEDNKANGLIIGTGRRKTSVARVFLYSTEKGEFVVNGMEMASYFPTEKETLKWMRPFHAVGVSHPRSQFGLSVKVSGSGKSAQLDAVVHGISRVLLKMDIANLSILRKLGFLTRDSRMVERKKYWLRKARKAPQYSKR